MSEPWSPRAWPWLPYRWQAEVVLATDLATAAAQVARTIGTLEEVGGETILRIGANEVEWLAGYIAGLPFDAEVRSPPEVRAAMRALGRRLQATHRARPPRPPRPGRPGREAEASGLAVPSARVVAP